MYQGTLVPASNRADYIGILDCLDADTGEGIDISGATEILMEIRDQRSQATVLTASLANSKITLVQGDGESDVVSAFQWRFTASDMAQFLAGTYDIGCVITINEIRKQILVGTVAVIDGVVNQ